MDRRIATALALTTFLLALPRTASGATACWADGPTLRLAITGRATATLALVDDGVGGTLLAVNGRACRGGAGRTAAAVSGDAAAQTLVLDLNGAGGFAGWTIEVALGGGADSLSVTGTPAADALSFSSTSLDLGADGSSEIAFVGIESLAARGGDGADRLDGSAVADPGIALHLSGGPGTDELLGGAGPDVLRGDDGKDDAMRGGPGDDALTGGRGIDRNGAWDCGDGSDRATFDRDDLFTLAEAQVATAGTCEVILGTLSG